MPGIGSSVEMVDTWKEKQFSQMDNIEKRKDHGQSSPAADEGRLFSAATLAPHIPQVIRPRPPRALIFGLFGFLNLRRAYTNKPKKSLVHNTVLYKFTTELICGDGEDGDPYTSISSISSFYLGMLPLNLPRSTPLIPSPFTTNKSPPFLRSGRLSPM